jgi:hypothetical protein
MSKRVTFCTVCLIALIVIGCSPAATAAPTTAASTVAVTVVSPTQATTKPTTAAATEKAATAAPTVAKPTEKAGSPAGNDINMALNMVMGSKDEPSVYPSYYMVVNMQTPSLNDDKNGVTIKSTQFSADVQDKNIHLSYPATDTTPAKEGYIIGENEYRITNGKTEEMMGQISLSWAFWVLEAIFPYSTGAAMASKTGTETLEGRQADVYTVDSDKAPAGVMESFRTFGLFLLNSSKGTIWIDQKTGGLLKVAMDYDIDVNDMDQKKVGTGKGHLEITITKVGQVTVQLP